MNKLFSKIAALSVGLTMAIGVGVALGSKGVREAKATDAEYSWSGYSSETSVDIDGTSFEIGDFELVASKGTGSNGPKYYKNGDAVRVYSNNTITVSSSTTAISKITFTTGSGTLLTANVTTGGGTFSSGVWTAADDSTKAVVLTVSATSRFSAVSISPVESSAGPFTVTYNGNGATSGSMTDSTEYESGTLVTIKTCEFMKTYYEVTGWNTKADGSGTSYVLSGQFNITTNVTLYAQWALQSKTLDNGSYKAILSYSNPIPSDIQLLNSSDTQVGVIGVSSENVSYKDNYSEYELAAYGAGKITFKNPTNAPLIKAVVNAYKYDEFNLKLGSVTLHSGDGSAKDGDPVVFEITPDTPSTDDIVIEHFSASNKYSQSLYSIELYFKLGSEVVHPTSVGLNSESGNVYVGKTRQLTATVLPSNADDRTVSWSSNNTAAVTVDENGLLTGVAAGTATITATTTDGGLTASFVATVKALSYGTLENPLSVEEAREVLEITGSESSEAQLFVTGKVYSSSYNTDQSYYTIWLQSSDGSVNRYFEVYKPTFDSSITGDYTASNALKGFVIVATGYGQIYSGTTYELTPANTIAPVIKSLSYTSEMIAALVLSETKSLCDAYVDGTSDYDEYKAALTTIWSGLKTKYNTLSDSDKEALSEAERDPAGSEIEQAMARYDFLTGKYDLENFISGRTPIVPAGMMRYGELADTNNTMIIVVVIAAVSALAFTTLLVFKKKKQK